MDKEAIKKAAFKTWRNFSMVMPVILGIFLLLSLMNTAIPKSFYAKLFTGNLWLDSFVGAAVGSISVGNPLTSYIVGGEMLNQGVSLVAVTAFLLGWVTVGIIQLPAESLMLGKRFAITRNLVSFILAIVVAVLTVLTLKLIQ